MDRFVLPSLIRDAIFKVLYHIKHSYDTAYTQEDQVPGSDLMLVENFR